MKKSKRSPDISKQIAIQITPDLRRRAERVHEAHNRLQPVPATKSSIYRSALNLGLQVFEKELALAGEGEAPTQPG